MLDWVLSTRSGSPLGQRNVQRSALHLAADAAGLRPNGARLGFMICGIRSPVT